MIENDSLPDLFKEAELIIILSTGITAWLMGWLNEKEANGSILSGWLLHGTLNLISSVFMMFKFVLISYTLPTVPSGFRLNCFA